MNPYSEKIAQHFYNDEYYSKTIAEFKRMENIEHLKHKAYVYELFRALDNIDTNLDRFKPDLGNSFVLSVCDEIKKARYNLSLLNFDKEFLEEGGLFDEFKLEGNSL
jgi:hypothetical protein